MSSWYVVDWSKYSGMALNFAIQKLKIYYSNIYELRNWEGKGKKGTPIKVHFILFLLYPHCNIF